MKSKSQAFRSRELSSLNKACRTLPRKLFVSGTALTHDVLFSSDRNNSLHTLRPIFGATIISKQSASLKKWWSIILFWRKNAFSGLWSDQCTWKDADAKRLNFFIPKISPSFLFVVKTIELCNFTSAKTINANQHFASDSNVLEVELHKNIFYLLLFLLRFDWIFFCSLSAKALFFVFQGSHLSVLVLNFVSRQSLRNLGALEVPFRLH